MNIKLNYLLIPLLIVSLAGNVLFYFKIGELEKEIQKINQNKDQLSPVAENENQNQNEKNSASTFPKEIWQEYTNHQLGFSIKFPQIVYGINRCSDEIIWVPVKIFEDNENGIVFITEEYYYDNWDRESQTNTGPCKKITYSLESLRENMTPIFEFKAMPKPWLGLAIMIKNINNDIELNKFIKNTYGPGCFAGEKELWKQEGIYEIRIEGEDWEWEPGTDLIDLGTTTCPWNYVYKILYAPEKNKVMSVNLGQECTFGTDPSSESFKCYNDEMIDSFKFE